MPGLEKLAVIGAGSVGVAAAYASTIDRLAREIVLYDVNGPRARSEVLDLRHGLQFVGGGQVDGGDDIEVCRGADMVVVTAGATHGVDSSRLDLAEANVRLVRTLLPRLLDVAPDALYLFVSNPVDVITYVAQDIAGLPHGRIIGSGTVLDTARLRYSLAERLGINLTNVHALVVGEHGDSLVVLWSSATVGTTPIMDVVGPDGQRLDLGDLDLIRDEVRDAAHHVIEGKGHTNLAIGLATAHIAKAIARDEHAVLPVSVRTEIEGAGEVCLSLPAVIGRAGVLAPIAVPLDDRERADLRASAAGLRKVIDTIGTTS